MYGSINENYRAAEILGPFSSSDEQSQKEYMDYLGNQFPELALQILLGGKAKIVELMHEQSNMHYPKKKLLA